MVQNAWRHGQYSYFPRPPPPAAAAAAAPTANDNDEENSDESSYSDETYDGESGIDDDDNDGESGDDDDHDQVGQLEPLLSPHCSPRRHGKVNKNKQQWTRRQRQRR